MMHHLIAQVAPQAFFDHPQIDNLPHKGISMQVSQSWKSVRSAHESTQTAFYPEAALSKYTPLR